MRWDELEPGDVLVDVTKDNLAYAVLSFDHSEGGNLLVFTLVNLTSASVRKHTRLADVHVHRCYRVLRGENVVQKEET